VYGLLNQTRDLNRNVLSVNALGQTSIIFPENSLSIALEMQVEILE
jgi:hypothetical protein